LPYFPDSSNAITSRFIVLKLTKSFFDNPNINLEQELLMELPNIFHLAVFSLELLNERGYFIQPKSAKDDVEIMEDMGSPIGRFVKERCNVSSEQWCTSEDLWKEWKKWCAEEDVFAGNDVWFFRNLKSAFPTINSKRKKNELGIFFKFYEGISINFVPF
jgi:putative DNA primase/helicase